MVVLPCHGTSDVLQEVKLLPAAAKGMAYRPSWTAQAAATLAAACHSELVMQAGPPDLPLPLLLTTASNTLPSSLLPPSLIIYHHTRTPVLLCCC